MQRLDGRLVHSATDLNDFTECVHLVARELEAASLPRERPQTEDPAADLIRRKGDEHERRVLERMVEQYGDGLVSLATRVAPGLEGAASAERAVLETMASGAQIIYQPTFFDGLFLGRADFLRRLERPAARWPWSYEVIDTKLALSPKPHFLIQLCHYSEHVARLQGIAPHAASIVLGTGGERSFRIEAYAPYYRRLKARYLESIAARADAYPLECSHCEICAWREPCATKRDRDDHLSLVAGMRHDQERRLEAAGLTTIAALAGADERARPKGMSAATFSNLRGQAAEQHRYRSARAAGTARHGTSFRPLEAGAGFTRLPEPQAGDIFFDMEGDPLYRPGSSLEYLFGAYLPDEPEGARYVAFWGTTPADERTAFEGFVDFVVERQRRYPGLHVYHYAPYETSALKRLGGRFGSREEAVDTFLRSHTFVDLYPIVRQSMWISQPSYSIKKVETFYGFSRSTETRAGDDSIVMFESWLESQDPAVLEDIRAYNEDDCRSTFLLRAWLVERRAALNATLAEPVPWWTPEAIPGPKEPSDERKRAELERTERERALLGGLGTPESAAELDAWPAESRDRYLLGNLLHYHRREAKSEWWEFFSRCERPTEMVEDRSALGGLRRMTEILPYRSTAREREVHTFSFPEQEYEIGHQPADADTRKSAGTVVRIDAVKRQIAIKLAAASDPDRVRALVPAGPLRTDAHESELLAIASLFLAGDLARAHPATEALLARRPPRLGDRPPGAPVQPETLSLESISATVLALRESALVIQGPPGTGKSTAGAHAIVALLRARKRVALTALSHAALHTLCAKVERVAAEQGVRFEGCHRSSDANPSSTYASHLARPLIGDPDATSVERCDLVSSPVYGWAGVLNRDPGVCGTFDVLVIDEAGQISLADALIASRLARSVVLLGDPQQLPQVSKGSHPPGADASILEHLLGTSATIAADRGIFLNRSYRLEPRAAEFISRTFYDGRLHAAQINARNRIDSPALSGGGMRYLAIAHEADTRRSTAEASRIVDEIAALLGSGATALRGAPLRPLGQRDILVVTPYNAQRAELQRLLAQRGLDGIAVGTVDKFQGQEAPVVFYSMATSTAELAPRGLDFLLSPNRLNVAISRAEALAVLACSPRLLDSRATSVENMRLLALVCAYVENAQPNPSAPKGALSLPFA